MFSPFLALRYLQPKRAFVSIITVISVLGVALGVWALTVVISVFTGYGEKIKNNILGFEPHLEIRAGGYMEDFVPIIAQLEKLDGIKSFTPYVWGSVIMEYRGLRSAPLIRSITPPKEGSPEHKRLSSKLAKRANPNYDPKTAPDQPEFLVAGEFHLDPYSTVIGDAMAQNLGIRVGDKITLFSPKDMEGILQALDEVENGDEETKKKAKKKVKQLTVPQEVTVTGIFDSGNWDLDANLIFLHLETGQVLYNFDFEQAHGISIYSENPLNINELKDDIMVGLEMGERKKLTISPAAFATHNLLKGNFLKVVVGLVAIIALIGWFLFRNNLVRVLLFVAGIAIVIMAFQWGNDFSETKSNQFYVEQTGGKPYQLMTWMQINKVIFDAIAAERQAMYLILFIMMILGGFCIMNTMITVTFQKRSEIGVMKALGAKESQVAWLFLLQGMIVALLGIILGIAIAQLTIWRRNDIADFIGKQFNVDIFSEEVYRIDGGLPAVQSLSDIVTISIAAFITCSLAALVPAVIAAHMQPAKALRSD